MRLCLLLCSFGEVALGDLGSFAPQESTCKKCTPRSDPVSCDCFADANECAATFVELYYRCEQQTRDH